MSEVKDKVILYGEKYSYSPFVFTVFVALREKGIPFEFVKIDLNKQEQKSADYINTSITGRVPSLTHNGFSLAESSAIVEYIEEVWPGDKYPPYLLPTDLHKRARARQILSWLRSDLSIIRDERSTNTMYFERATEPLSAKAQAAADKLIGVTQTLLSHSSGKFLFDEWTIVDADLSFMLHRLILNGDKVPQNIVDYAKANFERPTILEWTNAKRPEFVPY
eukprot:TRINITY_DN2020_c0_g1_i13.p1 TRINITY_DN2020_c0_g1~~TRINITY_DN2020_c0_g1_i13.p1  ORF type:complete len:221 (+),score=38.40 TRINITY_DN2020_c0_g1_i13:682-1344(+)